MCVCVCVCVWCGVVCGGVVWCGVCGVVWCRVVRCGVWCVCVVVWCVCGVVWCDLELYHKNVNNSNLTICIKARFCQALALLSKKLAF